MDYIFRWDGEYWGFISNDYVFTAASDYVGWIDDDGQVFRQDGEWVGELVDQNYILKPTTRARPARRARRARPARPARPAAPARRAGRARRAGWNDATGDLK